MKLITLWHFCTHACIDTLQCTCKKMKYIMENLMRHISPSKFLQWMLSNICLPMIHWQTELFYGYLLIQFCWSKHWGYSFSYEMVVEWQIYVHPDCIFCHSDGCKKVEKAHYWTIEPLSNFEFSGGETVIKTAEAKNMDQVIWHLWLWSPVPPKLSE